MQESIGGNEFITYSSQPYYLSSTEADSDNSWSGSSNMSNVFSFNKGSKLYASAVWSYGQALLVRDAAIK